MKNTIWTARWVAILFIIATVASIVSGVVTEPILSEPDYLAAITENGTAIYVGVFAMFVAAVAIAGIPITLMPLIRRHSETQAFAFFAARLTEAIMFVLGALLYGALVPLATATTDKATAVLIGDTLRALSQASFNAGPGIFFSLSAIILGWIFYRTKLVPDWLSLWKIAGGVLFLVQSVLILFAAATPLIENTLYLPIAINEMVLAIWLLWKGFDTSRLTAPKGAD